MAEYKPEKALTVYTVKKRSAVNLMTAQVLNGDSQWGGDVA